MRFDMLLHVISLDESLFAEWTLVGLLTRVDLPVPVKTAGICQCLPTLLTFNRWLTIGSNFSSSEIEMVNVINMYV